MLQAPRAHTYLQLVHKDLAVYFQAHGREALLDVVAGPEVLREERGGSVYVCERGVLREGGVDEGDRGGTDRTCKMMPHTTSHTNMERMNHSSGVDWIAEA